jgi:transcriptional regulator with XRE-family HTH domain
MGTSRRAIPKRLPAKLRFIREVLGFSQEQVIEKIKELGVIGKLDRSYVSGWESGKREPTLEVLLHYSELAGVWVNAIIDDEVDLPLRLPCSPMHDGIRSRNVNKSRKRRT